MAATAGIKKELLLNARDNARRQNTIKFGPLTCISFKEDTGKPMDFPIVEMRQTKIGTCCVGIVSVSYSTLHMLDMQPVVRKTLLARLFSRIGKSFQILPDIMISSLWACIISFAVLFPLWLRGHRSPHDFYLLIAIWIVGTFASCFFACVLARFFAGDRGAIKSFSAMMFFLFILTVIVPASLFSLQYRMYFSQWHDDFLTKFWFIEFIFTGANSFYLFVATQITPLITVQGVLLAIVFCWFFKPTMKQTP